MRKKTHVHESRETEKVGQERQSQETEYCAKNLHPLISLYIVMTKWEIGAEIS